MYSGEMIISRNSDVLPNPSRTHCLNVLPRLKGMNVLLIGMDHQIRLVLEKCVCKLTLSIDKQQQIFQGHQIQH